MGAGININPFKLAEPPGVVRLSAPEEPLPTTARMEVEETTVNDVTEVPPRVMADVLEKSEPEMEISVPAPAEVGEKDMIVGGGK